jgi:hypothetical protein
MGGLSSDRIAAFLERDRTLLDQIFGIGQYEIQDIDRDIATVRSADLEINFVYDRYRMRDVGTYITLLAVPEEVSFQHPLDTWARFVGEDTPRLARNASGSITVAPEEQVRNDLKRVARLVQKIFSDPQRRRDAAYFAGGYNKAYNDWASGNGSWSEPE